MPPPEVWALASTPPGLQRMRLGAVGLQHARRSEDALSAALPAGPSSCRARATKPAPERRIRLNAETARQYEYSYFESASGGAGRAFPQSASRCRLSRRLLGLEEFVL